MKKILILLNIFVLLNCKYEDSNSLPVMVYLKNVNYIIGKNGILGMKSNSHISGVFDRSDIETQTKFDIELSGSETNNNYTLNCRLWLGEDYLIDVLCKFPEGLKEDEVITSEQIQAISHYKNEEINININIENLRLYQANYTVPFLYNEPINITVNEKTNKINLELRMDSYNEEILFIRNQYRLVRLENCQKTTNTLNCEIPRAKLDEIANTENAFEVIYVNDYIGWTKFEFVDPINIKYNGYTKQNINFKLEKLQENNVDRSAYVTFSTNVNNIPTIKTATFSLKISSSISTNCYFIKPDKSKPLYFTCHASTELDNYIIGDIQGQKIENIHYKYDFTLQPGKIEDPITIKQPKGTFIIHIYPETLDYTKSENDLDIYIAPERIDRISFVTLNEEDILSCENINNIKKCKVPKRHFEGKKERYFFLNHYDNWYNFTANYEAFGIKVVLPGDNINPGNSGEITKYSLGLFALLLILAL